MKLEESEMDQKIVGFCVFSIFLASLILNFYFIKKDVRVTATENEGNTGLLVVKLFGLDFL